MPALTADWDGDAGSRGEIVADKSSSSTAAASVGEKRQRTTPQNATDKFVCERLFDGFSRFFFFLFSLHYTLFSV